MLTRSFTYCYFKKSIRNKSWRIMKQVRCFITCIVAWILLATASTASPVSYPSSPQHMVNSSLHTRQDPPEVPERPATSGPTSFHGSRFEFLKETGFEPAVDAMPVFLFARTARFLVRDLRFTPKFRTDLTVLPATMLSRGSNTTPWKRWSAWRSAKTKQGYQGPRWCKPGQKLHRPGSIFWSI